MSPVRCPPSVASTPILNTGIMVVLALWLGIAVLALIDV